MNKKRGGSDASVNLGPAKMAVGGGKEIDVG